MHNKPYSEACVQNREPIIHELKRIFCNSLHVLEIGSGTGQHAAYFPEFLPHIQWHPSDVAAYLPGIEAWRSEAALKNVSAAVRLDVNQPEWPPLNVDAVFSANAIHIMSWSSVKNLIKGVTALLQKSNHPDRLLCFYGPFNYHGNYSSESNARFDQWLKNRDPASGIRHFEELCELASENGMSHQDDIKMPANNRLLVFRMND